MRSSIRRVASAAALSAVILTPTAFAADGPSTYDNDPDYQAFDEDNQRRSDKKQQDQATSTAYGQAFAQTAFESHADNQIDQVRDANRGRVYATLGQHLAGGSIGNPEHYYDVTMTEIDFFFRDGAKLEGHVFHSQGAEPGPAVLITTGSIQGTQHMYWWAARTLAQNGYTVMTWDVQGQGESETFGHEPGSAAPTMTGVPFQQGYNFTEGTIDALKFLLSTPEDPYVPTGWSDEDVATQRAYTEGENIDWFNPAHIEIDHVDPNVGLAGHSLGGGSVAVVQQCSDMGDVWSTLEICDNQSFPIRAAVGWDSLSSGVIPVVPGMDQQGDGYFFNSSPSQTAPDAAGHLGAYNKWTEAGIDVMDLSVRGGTHIEWTEIPYVLPSTEYGVFMADYYTLAWMDRYVSPDATRNLDGYLALASGPMVDSGADQYPWRANFLSGRYTSAMSITDPAGNTTVAEDLRVYGGAAATGDWAALNAETSTVRYGWADAGHFNTTNDGTGR